MGISTFVNSFLVEYDCLEWVVWRVLKKYLVGDVVGRSSGRNVDGHITVHHRGGGVKNRYRILSKLGASIAGLVVDIVYDPTRTAKLAIVSWGNGLISQIICPTNVVVGS